eukprot:Protomagalhaensia_sp_Gyna_25__1973@NODE_2053_length_1322_cov_190_794232_g1695_i0_p1_GENE_NODE_2053_length_1322_cov_190_794232_g1695_i0NODE_2053_length_1322_cov_190_794232_g1695_i0_p1_ORF_typecomplete_len298_score63_04HA/PF03457_14/0_21G6PD_N/PF00479_22/0_64G6PD_N/PF00479_22/1_3e03_NODE_2053_length_1322_cov_190_794232_g1695_i04011294
MADGAAGVYVDYLEVLASKWSSSSAASHINPQLLAYLQPRFHRCSTPIKIRVVLSFLYLSEEARVSNRKTLLKILAEAEVDRDEWVRKLARLVSSFVVVGSIDVRETDSETAYHLLKFLNTQREKHRLLYLSKPPLEAPHLANVLSEKAMRAEVVQLQRSLSEKEDQKPHPAEKAQPPPQLFPNHRHITPHELQAARDAATPFIAAQRAASPVCQSLNSIHPFAPRDTDNASSQTTRRTSIQADEEDLFEAFLQRSKVCVDSTNFQPKIDFLAFNTELMRPGEHAMRKTLKKMHPQK